MKNKIQTPFPDDHCFFCKNNNNFGFKLDFFWDANKQEASAEYLPPIHYCGQRILHNGIQMGLLDEIMGWASHIHTKKIFVTSDLNLKFLHPAHIHENKINITCRVMSIGSKLKMQARISDHMGVICTTATGIYHLLSPEKDKELIPDPQNKKGKKFKSALPDKKTMEILHTITPDPLARNIEWILGPDRDMNWYEAREWVISLKINGDWRMPSIAELRSLCNQNSHKTITIHSSFKTSGWWLWSEKGDGPLAALGLDIHRGRVVSGGRALVSGGRIFAVRTIG